MIARRSVRWIPRFAQTSGLSPCPGSLQANQARGAKPSLIRANGAVMENFGELPEGDQGQFEGHRTFRALEAYTNTSLAGRQENSGVHAEAPDFASDLHQEGGVGEWQNGIFGVSWHGVSLGAGNTFAPST
jgi:hypothetical protein